MASNFQNPMEDNQNIKTKEKETEETENEVLEQLRCPICDEVPTAEIYQCTSGHTLCSFCLPKVNNCPQCREPFQKNGQLIRVRALESLLDSIKILCPYSKKGCDVKTARKHMEDHKINCIQNGKSLLLCKILGYQCNHWSISKPAAKADEWRHFSKEHKAKCFGGLSGLIQIEYFRSLTETMETDGIWTPVFFKTDDWLFALCTMFNYKDNSVSWVCLNVTDSPKLPPRGTLQFEVEVSIGPGIKVDTELKWKMFAVPVLELQDKSIENYLLLRVPAKELIDRYANQDDGTLNFKVKITANPAMPDRYMGRNAYANCTTISEIIPRVPVCEAGAGIQDVAVNAWHKTKTTFFEMWSKVQEHQNHQKSFFDF